MMMFLGKFWIAALVVPYCMALHNLRYSDLEATGSSCHRMDTCAMPTSKNFAARNCECDSQCQVFDDCCIDADLKTNVQRSDKYTCVQDGLFYRGAYAISKCRRGWSGPELVQQRCESINDFSDPLVSAPVTHSQNGVIYKNRYCAECNDAHPSLLQSWAIVVSCKSLSHLNSTSKLNTSFIRENLVYESTPPHKNKWGVYHWDKDSDRGKFYPCDLRFQLPKHLHDSVRMCRPNVISTCPGNWKQNSVREKCAAYMAALYGNNNTYRNPHCAICNKVDPTTLACAKGVDSRTKPPMSFTLILDINLKDGDRVGEVNRCPEGKQYDTFFKKCRKLVCALKGFVMKGDTCVKE